MNKEEDIIYNKTQHYGRTQFVRELAKLQEEKEKLQDRVEYLERSNDRREDEIIYLRQELSGEGDILLSLRQELNDREDKIDKAIKYIEEERKLNNEFDMIDIMNYEDFDVVYAEDLLKILKGENNE